MHHGCVVDPARPHHTQDKALVERSVELVYQRIYYHVRKHTYFSLKDLNQAITELLEGYNDYLFFHGGGSRRSYFIDLEKQYLQDKLEVFYNHDRITSHERNIKAGNYKTIADHMPSSHQAYGQWSPEYFQDRARQIGPFTLAYIERLLIQYNYPEIACKQSQGILSFVKTYNKERLEGACERALAYHKASYRTIEMILKNSLDTQEQDLETQSGPLIPEHGNIRGASYYR